MQKSRNTVMSVIVSHVSPSAGNNVTSKYFSTSHYCAVAADPDRHPVASIFSPCRIAIHRRSFIFTRLIEAFRYLDKVDKGLSASNAYSNTACMKYPCTKPKIYPETSSSRVEKEGPQIIFILRRSTSLFCTA
jgi:hypothetical protein